MIGKVRSRGHFSALRSSRHRANAGPVRISFVSDGFSQPCFAFALSRKVGNAVVRNRLRRQLRAICTELAPELSDGAYLIAVSAEAVDLSYGELRAKVNAATAAIGRQVDK